MSSLSIGLVQAGAGQNGSSPLSAEHLLAFAEAEKRGKKIRRARGVALTDGWIMSVFAGATLLTGIFSLPSIVLGAAMGLIAMNSFRGARMLKRLDVRGPRVLMWNQLMLAGVLTVYAGYSIWIASRGDDAMSAAVKAEPGLAGSLGDYSRLMWLLTLAVYGGLIGATVVAQGLTAWYYGSRRKHLEAYFRETPGWIVEFQRARD